MERDILRRTHNVFSTLKDESGNKYEDRDSSVMFVDDNTIKYQNMVKKMEKKSGNGSGESEDSDVSDDCKEQTLVITTNVKHVGKGVIVQSFDISDDDDDGDDDDDDVSNGDSVTDANKKALGNKVPDYIPETKTDASSSSSSYHRKKVAYHQESEVNVDDI